MKSNNFELTENIFEKIGYLSQKAINKYSQRRSV